MSTANVVNFPMPDESPDHDARAYSIAITGSGIYNDCLCLQYAVTPIPAALVGDRSLHEGGDAGIAIDNHRNVRRECRSAYRVAMTGSRVVGALKVGPAAWPGLGTVTVLFYPFAHTPGLHRRLCQVRVILDGTGVRSATIHRT